MNYPNFTAVSSPFKNATFSTQAFIETLIGRLLGIFCILLSACQAPVQPQSVVKTTPADNKIVQSNDRALIAALSVVNTTENTFLKDGVWQSNMGPLTTQKGGLACDNVARDMQFHGGEYRLWHIAPSDAEGFLGMKKCSPNTQGKNSEPSCFESWSLCGRKIRVKCLDPEFCGNPGEPSLASQINKNEAPRNNFVPEVIVNELSQALGKNPKTAESVVLYVTDFCPAGHSYNIKTNQCQRPQVDISTAAFLVMGKANKSGYINTQIDVSVELLDPNDTTPVGPEY
jgi:hypothetical protein